MNFIQHDRTETARILISQIGKRVINISKIEYHFNEELPKEEDGEIEIQFEDGKRYAFEILNDAENIDINLKELVVPEAFEISNENFCRWEKKSLFELKKYAQLQNEILEKIEVIKDYFDNRKECVFAGVRLTFSNKDKLHFINEGDEARFYLNREDKIKILNGTIIEEIKKDTEIKN